MPQTGNEPPAKIDPPLAEPLSHGRVVIQDRTERFDSGVCISSSGKRGQSQKNVTFEIEFLDPGVEVFSFTFG